MRRPERDGEIQREVTGRERVVRDPMPTDRAILWKPLPDSYHLLASMMRATAQQAFLFVTQRAFLQVERHIRSAPDLELGGFLAGQLFQCPRTQVRYAVINTVVPFADVSNDPLLSRVTQETFDAVKKRLDRHQLSLIGWYRNGAGLGLQLLPDDVETHVTFFDQPWQTTLLVMPDATKPKGAFFTYDARVSRSYCIPFYELFDSPNVDARRLDRTCVTWTTYVAAEPVAPLPVAEREVVEATVAPPRKPTPEPEPREPIDEWWDAIKDPWVKLKDVAVSATRREDSEPSPSDSPPVSEAPKATPLARPALKIEPPQRAPTAAREQRVPDERASVSAPVLSAVPRPTRTVAAAAQPAPAQPLPVQPKPVQAPSAEPAQAQGGHPQAVPVLPPFTRPAPRERPQAAARSTAPAASPRRRPVPPVPMPMASANGPAVALPPDFHEEAKRWQRRRRIGLAVAAVSFLGVIVLSTLRPRPGGGPPPPAPAIQSMTSTGLTVAMAGTPEPVEISLGAAVDSLSGALAYYRDIATDHRDGLVGCRVLDRAYALVGRARTRVDSTRQQIAGGLTDADSIRVSMLGAEYTHVTQTYRRSGCRA
jgi:hypothetical protein